MADNHGNSPAAWTAVAVAMLGFLVGSVACMQQPISMTLLWIGLALGAIALPVFLIMARMGLHTDHN